MYELMTGIRIYSGAVCCCFLKIDKVIKTCTMYISYLDMYDVLKLLRHVRCT